MRGLSCQHLHQRKNLLSVCLAGVILLLPLSWVVDAQYDYSDSTAPPDYADYNATFDYTFYSNTSSEDLEKFLSASDIVPGNVPEVDMGGGQEEEEEEEEEGEGEAETVTMTTTAPHQVISTTERERVQIHSSAPPPATQVSLVARLLLAFSLTVHQLRGIL